MYEEKTFEAIQEGMLARIKEDIDKREGSIIWDSTAAVACELETAYFQLRNFMDLVFGDTAAGIYLDRFAEEYGLKRKEAVRAVRLGIFDREFPAGVRFFTGGETALVFVTRELKKKENGIFTYYLECETPGQAGNVVFGNLIPAEYINGLTRADLGGIVVAGTEKETDASLRERLFSKIRRPSTSGNVNDYYNWTMACPGVGAAKIYPLANGPGTVKIVITDENKRAAGSGLISNVREHIEELRPVGATVSIVSATEKTINVSARVRLKGVILGTAQSQFEEAITEYLQQSAFSASYVSLARVGNLLMSIPGVEDYADLKINGVAGNVAIGPQEVAVTGTVRVEVILNGSQ